MHKFFRFILNMAHYFYRSMFLAALRLGLWLVYGRPEALTHTLFLLGFAHF